MSEITAPEKLQVAGDTPGKSLYTPTQGQYLAFIHHYTQIQGRPPAQADIQRFFRVTPPTVHQMILRLEKLGLLSRIPGKPRSLQVLIPAETLPVLTPPE